MKTQKNPFLPRHSPVVRAASLLTTVIVVPIALVATIPMAIVGFASGLGIGSAVRIKKAVSRSKPPDKIE